MAALVKRYRGRFFGQHRQFGGESLQSSDDQLVCGTIGRSQRRVVGLGFHLEIRIVDFQDGTAAWRVSSTAGWISFSSSRVSSLPG